MTWCYSKRGKLDGDFAENDAKICSEDEELAMSQPGREAGRPTSDQSITSFTKSSPMNTVVSNTHKREN